MSNTDIEKQTTSLPVARITTSGTNDEFLHIGETRFYKHELIQAFGGNLNVGLSQAPSRRFGNPGPLGLSAFALTTFCLSLVNVQARGVTNASGVVGLAMFYGGFIQLCAGMWEIVLENTFGATALSSYGGFWMAWGAIESDLFGIASSYKTKAELNNMLSFFLLGWFIFTAMMTTFTLKSTVLFFSLFFCLSITFLMLAIGHFANSVGCIRAGGVLGIVTAFLAWYNAFAGIANKENSYILPHVIYMPGTVRA